MPNLPDPIASQKNTVRVMFSSIAKTYDPINRLLSLGRDQNWRKTALKLAQIPHQGRLLDIATGTGDLALLAKANDPSLRVVGTDLTPAMLQKAQHKDTTQAITWIIGDGLQLPYPDNTYDAVISVFMMRNIPDVAQALQEQWRVVKPGGKVVCLEMTWPQWWPMTWLFRLYFFTLPPLIGGAISGNRQAYQYLPQSVKHFLSPKAMAQKMVAANLHNVTYHLKMLGSVAIHVGEK